MDMTKAILDALRELTTRVNRLETLESPATGIVITEGIVTAYDGATHTATVTVDAVSYAGLGVAASVLPYQMRAAVNVGATVGIREHDPVTPANGYVVYVISTGMPPNPFDPITGHKHRGLVDDGPTL